MDPSLSLVLHAFNVQDALESRVAHALEILADLGHAFEIVVVDDGSTDQTEEVAHELARQYPQLLVCRHPRPLGASQSVRTALGRAAGQLVLLQDATVPLSQQRLSELCRNPESAATADRGALRLVRGDRAADNAGASRPPHGRLRFNRLPRRSRSTQA